MAVVLPKITAQVQTGLPGMPPPPALPPGAPPMPQTGPPATMPQIPMPGPLNQAQNTPGPNSHNLPQGPIPGQGASLTPTPTTPATTPAEAPAGGGGGGGGGKGPAKLGDPGKGMNALIQNQLKGIISGKFSPFSAKTLDALNQQTAESARAQELNNRDQITRDAISRGMFRSGATGAELAAATRGAGSQITQGARANAVEGAKANFQARQQALQQSQQWLDSLRTWVLNSDKNAMQKQQMMASIAQASASAKMQEQQMQLGIVEQIMNAGNVVM